MADDSAIDPRYAAEFQRGFDPEQHVPTSPRRGPMRLAGGPVSTASRVPDPPGMAPPPEVTEAADAPAPEVAAEPPAPIALTWWDWLLPGVGVVLIGISLALWWSLGTDTASYFGTADTDRWDLLISYARYELAGPVLIAGVLAVTTGVVLQVARPRR
jgi:hypothetical protein